MPTRRVEFIGSLDKKLAGIIELPNYQPKAWALFAHCFTCSKDIMAAVRIARELVASGYGVLRFDFTGLGSSEGEFSDTTFSSNVGDLIAAANWMGEHYQAPKLLVGHSLGGAAVLAAARHIDSSVAVATIAAPFEPAHVADQFGHRLEEIKSQGQAQVELAGRTFTIKKSFVDDLSRHRQAENIRKLRKPLMVLHAPLDNTVPVESASQIFQTAYHPKTYVSLDEADHLLSRKRDAEFAASMIATWAKRFILAEAPAHQTEQQDDWVHVEQRSEGDFTVAIQAGPHEFWADEPKAVGGDDMGPSPYQLLTSGLGACTAMTIRMYARRKDIPLKNVRVQLKHDKKHAKDCEECETKHGKVDHIERLIYLEGDLTDQQREKLIAIANKCPVHRTLNSEIKVTTRQANN